MEGIAAIKLTAGFNILCNHFGQTSAIKIDVKIPIGTPTITAPTVTASEPIIIGNIPNVAGVLEGAHFCPNKKSPIPYSSIKGTPPAKIKIQIKIIATTDVSADTKKTPFINPSNFFVFIYFSFNIKQNKSSINTFFFNCIYG